MKGSPRTYKSAKANQQRAGMFKQMPFQASAAAVNTSQLKTQFDALLSKLVASERMASPEVVEPEPSMIRQHLNTRNGFGVSTNISLNPNSANSFNQRLGLSLTDFASQIQLGFINTRMLSSGGKVWKGESDLTISCAFEVGSEITPITWNGGQSSVVVEPDEFVMSDYCDVTLPPGLGAAVLRMHGLWATPPATLPIANGVLSAVTAYDSNSRGVNQANGVLGTMPTGISVFGAICPPMIITGLTSPEAAIITVGDSNRAWSNSGLSIAQFRRINTGIDAFTMAGFDAEQRQQRFRATVEGGFTHAFVTIGGGDVTAGASGSTLIARATSIRDYILSRGLKPVFATTPPKSNPTNTAVKSASAFNAIKTYNDYLRSNNGMGFGYFDLFDQWGDRTTGLWRTDLGTPTDDGTHANAALHTAAATAFASAAPSLFV